MALTTLDQLLAAPRHLIMWQKIPASGNATTWFSPWLVAGVPTPPSAPAMGVTGAALTDATAGALGTFPNPTSGLTYLLSGGAVLNYTVADQTQIILCDRLWHNSGLSPTTTTSQSVGSVTLPSRCPVKSDPTGRTFDALGHGIEAWWEVYTTMGAGTVAPTISYTDEAGNAGNTATAQRWASALAAGHTLPFDRVAGDTGVRSIETYQQTATQTSGTFGLVLRRRLATLVGVGRVGMVLADWSQLGAVIPDDACLEVLFSASASYASNTFAGMFTLGQG